MTQLRVTRQAARDLAKIADWTLKEWGPAQMERYLRDLDARLHWLAVHPLAGRDRADVAAGYRSFPQGRHLVFYLVEADGIAVIGVIHQAMDVRGRFKGGTADGS